MDASFATNTQIPISRLNELKVKSNLRGGLQAGSHLAAIALNTFALAHTWGSWWMAPLFVTQGVLINCLYAGVHELSHGTVFKQRHHNVWLGRLFTFFLLMGYDQDKFEHFQHHRHTQDVDKDAEIVGGKPFTLTTYLLYLLGVTYWFERILEVVRLALGHTDRWPHLSRVQLGIVHREARVLVFLYGTILAGSIATGSAAALYYWLLPMLTMKWFHNMQNIAEHTGMPYAPEIMNNTRTMHANPVMKWLLWNMPYHTAHHLYPIVPFHCLPELHREIVAAHGREPQTVTHLGFQLHMLRKLVVEGTSAYTKRDITAY